MIKADGTIIKVFGACYTVLSGSEEFICNLRGKFRTGSAESVYTDPVVVGDRVLLTLSPDRTGIIDELLPRRNVFSRKEKGRNRNEDIIASNLDTIVVIQAFQRPRLNLRFADRIIVRAIKEGIDVVVCVNKLDLADEETIEYIQSYYDGSGVRVIYISAQTGELMDSLVEIVHGRVSLFIGNSGVGKSSILNALMPALELHTIEISDKTGKGRHATTNVGMIMMDESSFIIDTPGLREFGLLDIEPHMLERYFMEFPRYHDACSFRPCTHDHEPHCAIREMAEEGVLSYERYISYLNILYSLKEYQLNRY